MSVNMKNSGGGFSGSHRAAQRRSSANKAAAAELNRAMQAAKRAAHPINQPGAMAKAMQKAMLGRRGAYGVPGRPPRIPGKLLGRVVPGWNLIMLLEDFNNMGLEWMMQDGETVPGHFAPEGWTRCPTPDLACQSTWGSPTHQLALSGGPCLAYGTCPTNQVFSPSPPNTMPAGSPTPFAALAFVVRTGTNPFGTPIGTYIAQYRRTSSGTVASPWVPEAVGPERALPLPASNPEPDPDTRFQFPKKPGARWLPKFQPSAEPWVGGETGGGGASGDWGPGPTVDPVPDLDVDPDVDLDDDLAPYERPAVNIPMTPDGPDKPTIVVHRDLPPPRHIKEVKWKLPRSKLGDFYGALTEIKDFLEAANRAIPDSPCGSGGLHTRFACVVKNAHKIDPVIFMKEAARMQLEDYTIGKANQLANQITKSPYWQRPVGQGFGSFSHRMR